MFRSLIRAAGSIGWRELAVSRHYCPLCDAKRLFVRLGASSVSVRCTSCRATPITLSLISVLRQVHGDMAGREVYELSARGPLVKYLGKAGGSLTCSEFLDGAAPGEYVDGVQCQDVQALTFPDGSFDLCTSTDVFEHVPDDARGFAEIRRVLRPAGMFVFTVPLRIDEKTAERARLTPVGEVEHLLPLVYHMDPIRGHDPILAFRSYGFDILDRLITGGFRRAEIRAAAHPLPWGYGRPVVVAYREPGLVPGARDDDPLLIRFVQSD